MAGTYLWPWKSGFSFLERCWSFVQRGSTQLAVTMVEGKKKRMIRCSSGGRKEAPAGIVRCPRACRTRPRLVGSRSRAGTAFPIKQVAGEGHCCTCGLRSGVAPGAPAPRDTAPTTLRAASPSLGKWVKVNKHWAKIHKLGQMRQQRIGPASPPDCTTTSCRE